MNNQRGEVVLGVMVVMMAVMMLFGGMHVLHGEQRCGGDHRQNNEKQNQLDEGSQHQHSSGAQAIAPAQEDAK